jgi:hypothetical protein
VWPAAAGGDRPTEDGGAGGRSSTEGGVVGLGERVFIFSTVVVVLFLGGSGGVLMVVVVGLRVGFCLWDFFFFA